MPVAQSSHIGHYTYDADIATLSLTFVNGSKYLYTRVPETVYNDFHRSQSKGSFLHRNIIGNYPVTKVHQGRGER
jgi:hypothetical protein